MSSGPGPRIANCDTMVALAPATATATTLFAKNSDRPPGECQPLTLVERARHPPGASVRCQYVEIPQVRQTARVLGSRPIWLWGFEHGVNEFGVAIGNETIFAREAPSDRGLLGMDLVRLGLERSATADEALDVLTGLIEAHGQGGSGFREFAFPYHSSFLIADRRGGWILEALGHHWAARRCRSTDSISNQITIGRDWDRLSDGIAEHGRTLGLAVDEPFDFSRTFRDVENVPRALSEGRLRQSRRGLEGAGDRVGFGTLCGILRDHHGSPIFRPGAAPEEEAFYTICMHQGVSRTTASLVADLGATPGGMPLAWVGFGRPCCGLFFPVLVGSYLPEIFARGSDEPDGSLWWIFESISCAVEAEPARAAEVRRAFDPVERELHRAATALAGRWSSLPEEAIETKAREFLDEVASRVEAVARSVASGLGLPPDGDGRV